jgi:LPXTG-site transpeptidase (sortase) family protein
MQDSAGDVQTTNDITGLAPQGGEDQKFDIPTFLIRTGKWVIVFAVIFAFIAFYKPLFEELKYLVTSPDESTNVVVRETAVPVVPEGEEAPELPDEIVASDPEFSIVIPKINANSRVIGDVNPYDSRVYQQALTKGVAHAQNTSYPGEEGNTFLFSHSSVNFYEANRYNSVFYLLNKLDEGDDFYLVYNNKVFNYKVNETKVVNATDVEYIKGDETKKTATLMTCWPAGTTYRRLVVVGELIEN